MDSGIYAIYFILLSKSILAVNLVWFIWQLNEIRKTNNNLIVIGKTTNDNDKEDFDNDADDDDADNAEESEGEEFEQETGWRCLISLFPFVAKRPAWFCVIEFLFSWALALFFHIHRVSAVSWTELTNILNLYKFYLKEIRPFYLIL